MKVLRINETVNVSTKVLQESAHAIIDTYHGANPFTIPVSHLLRVERHRGFEHGHSTKNQFHLHRSDSSARSESLRFRKCRHDATPRHTAVTVIAPLNIPHTRSLSSHGGTPRPPPPRRPPPPPHRRPLVPRPVNSALAFPDDDVLSSIPTTTSDELNRQSNIVRERDRKRQIIEDTRYAPWFKFAAELDTKFGESARTIRDLQINVRNNHDAARQRVKYLFEKGRRMVNDIEKRVRQRELEYKAVLSEHKSNLAVAGKQGRKDFRTRQDLIKRAQRDIFWEADRIAHDVDTLRKDLAELMYTIFWTAWKTRRTRFQTEQAIQASYRLKDEANTQTESRKRTNEIADTHAVIAKLLDNLDEDLMSGKHSMSRTQAKHFVKIFALSLDIETFSSNIAAAVHKWRTLNHHALIDSRYPQLNDHVSVEIRARYIIDEIREDAKTLGIALRKVVRLPMMGRSTARFGGRLTIYTAMRRVYHKYNDLFVLVFEQYLSFLQNGLFMLNPAMGSDAGRLKYAMMRPFYIYSASILETRKNIRDSIATLKNLYERTDSKNKSEPKFAVTRPIKDRIWADSIQQTYEAALDHYKESVREILGLSNEALNRVFSRLSADNHPYLLEKYTQEAQRAETVSSQERALTDFSSLAALSDHTAFGDLADPLGLLGKQELYPQGKAYPVELVSSHGAITKALNELLLESVVGIDLFYKASISQQGALISIATTEKVVIIDWRSWTTSGVTALGMNQILLTRLMEDANILKVIHSMDVAQSFFTDRNVFPKNVTSLTKSQPSRSNGRLLRNVSTGIWEPPRHTVDNTPVMSFITSVAFLSVYNLWTFLRPFHPTVPITSDIDPRIRTNAMRAREKLVRNNAVTGQDTAPELGPLKVDEDGQFYRLTLRFNADPPGRNALLRLARLAAKVNVSHFVRSASFHTEDDFAAYYMFTALGQELSLIEGLLRRRRVASDILRVARENELTLYPKDREKLELAETAKQEDSSHAQVDLEPGNAPTEFETLTPSSSNIISVRNKTREHYLELHPTLHNEILRIQKMKPSSRKQTAMKRLLRISKQLSEPQTSDMQKESISTEKSQGGATYIPFKLEPKDQATNIKATKIASRKSRLTRSREKSTGQLKSQKISRKSIKTVSLSSTTRQPGAVVTKSKDKRLDKSLSLPPTIVPDLVQNVLTTPKRKTIGRLSRLRTSTGLPGSRSFKPSQNNDEKEIEQQPVSNLHQVKTGFADQVMSIFKGARSVLSGQAESISRETSSDHKGNADLSIMTTAKKSETDDKAANVFKGVRTVLSEKNDTTSGETKRVREETPQIDSPDRRKKVQRVPRSRRTTSTRRVKLEQSIVQESKP